MKYRPHRRFLDEAMAEVVDLKDREALVRHLAKSLGEWGYQLTNEDVQIKFYGYDSRIGWNTHIVVIRNKVCGKSNTWFFGKEMGPDYFGAIGFTDGPALKQEEAMGQLADWKCHKIVKAGKITAMPQTREIQGQWHVMVEDVNGAPTTIEMPPDAFNRGTPARGDYIVIYDDGYKSWSPAKAFEDGYERLSEGPV